MSFDCFEEGGTSASCGVVISTRAKMLIYNIKDAAIRISDLAGTNPV